MGELQSEFKFNHAPRSAVLNSGRFILRQTIISRRKAQRNSGQVLIYASLAAIALLGMVGLALDGGNLYMHKRQMQNAADAAALAGAQTLKQAIQANQTPSDGQILQAIKHYAQLNRKPDVDKDLVASYSKDGVSLGVGVGSGTVPNDANGVEVTTAETMNSFFLRILGIASYRAQARAAARFTIAQSGGFGMFAGNRQDADSIKTTGPDYLINGNVHSNSGITNSGGGYVVNGMVEYGTTTTGVNNWAINPAQNNLNQVPPQPYPVDYKLSDFAPGSAEALKAAPNYYPIQGNLTLGPNTPPGLYYVNGNVSASTKFNLNVTIVATGFVSISSPESVLKSYTQNLAIFSNLSASQGPGGKAIHISSGGNSLWDGIIFGPNGTVHFSMPNGVLNGGLIGDKLDITGPSFALNANVGGPNSPGNIILYQ
jgi:hypothetical protein